MSDPSHTLDVQVLTPEGPVFSGELVQLTAKTTIGEVGILASHAPMLARLVPAELRLHHSENEIERYATAEGYLEVFANTAVVLVGEAVAPAELDPGALREQLADAERQLGETEEGTGARDRAEMAKQRAEAFLHIAESD